MAQQKVTVGSRWVSKCSKTGVVFTVLECKPFGKLDMKREDKPIFISITKKALLQDWDGVLNETTN